MDVVIPESWRRGGHHPSPSGGRDPRNLQRRKLNSSKHKHIYLVGTRVDLGCNAAQVAAVNWATETAGPPDPDNPLGGKTMRTLTMVRRRDLAGAGATVCLGAQPTEAFRAIPASRIVGMNIIILGGEECVVPPCPCCFEAGTGMRHA